MRCECRQARRNGDCKYFTEYDKNTNPMPSAGYSIEELHLMGRLLETCSYYVVKKQALNADMVLMPYNYLIDEEIRERTKISYRNSIIIIDEAHNIASCSEESASFDVNTQFLQATIEELKQLKNKCLATEQAADQGDEYYMPKRAKTKDKDKNQDESDKKVKGIKKWKFKSKYQDIQKLYELTVNFHSYLQNFKLPKDLKPI